MLYAQISETSAIGVKTMSESVEGETKPAESDATPARKFIGKPFQKGASGNPGGRPRIEPRVRRYARRYDRRMCKVLATIAEDEKAPMSERRKAAMDLISVGSGRPALIQEIAGRDGAQLGPLVSVNLGVQQGQPLTPEQAYKMMVAGIIEASGDHPAFQRPALEQPSVSKEKSEEA
jgi:hypothetical protein